MYKTPRKGKRSAARYATQALASAAASRIGSWWKGRQAARAKVKDDSRKRKKTPSNTRAREGSVINEGVGGQYSEFNYSGPSTHFVAKLAKEVAPASYITNGAGQQLVTAGVQAPFLAMSMADSASMNLISSSSKVLRLVLKSAIGEVFMANGFKANVRMTIYDIIARRDQPTTSIQNPYAAWGQGSTDAALGTALTTVGGTPWETDTFNHFYKVLQRTELVLAGGAVHRHRVKLNYNKLIAGAEATYYSGWKDVTYHCMVVISGQPAHDTTTKTAVTLGTGGIDYTYQIDQKWCSVSNNQVQLYRTNNLATNTFAVGEAAVLIGGTATGTNAEA